MAYAQASSVAAGPCGCSPTGASGGVDTGAAGCGQHLVPLGSNQFVCFVNVSWARVLRSGVTQYGVGSGSRGGPACGVPCGALPCQQCMHFPCLFLNPMHAAPRLQDPRACTSPLTATSAAFPGASFRPCDPAAEPASALPSTAALLLSTPQLSAFYAWLVQANLTRVPAGSGRAITGGWEGGRC